MGRIQAPASVRCCGSMAFEGTHAARQQTAGRRVFPSSRHQHQERGSLRGAASIPMTDTRGARPERTHPYLWDREPARRSRPEWASARRSCARRSAWSVRTSSRSPPTSRSDGFTRDTEREGAVPRRPFCARGRSAPPLPRLGRAGRYVLRGGAVGLAGSDPRAV